MNTSCPTTDQIHRCCDGMLSADETQSVLDHAEVCGSCLRRIEDYEQQGSSFLEALCRSDGVAENLEPGCRRMIAAAAELADSIVMDRSELAECSGTESEQVLAGAVLADTPASAFRGSADAGPPRVAEDSSSSADLRTFQSGERFGDYEILSEIARGGMGVVFRARHVNLNRTVALKMILDARLCSDQAIARFRTEAAAAAQLEHPGIVPIYEVGETDGQHFFSMMLIETGCLKSLIQDQELTPRDAARMVSQVARIVQFAHSRNIVHRDLKPGNVLIDEEGRPRLTDFGLAKDLTDHSHLTSDGQVMGTPSYMSPEQAAGRSEQVGPVSDVYALGAILYHLVTGRPPFQERSILKTLQQVVSEEPESPRKLNPQIGLDLATICLKCLEKPPELRYSSAGELADDLDGYLRGEPISARAISWPERARRWCRRNPAPFYGTLITLVISCGAILYAALTFEQEVDSFASTLDDVAWRSLHETADWVADSAERELLTKFRQVDAAAGNTVLKEHLKAIVRDPEVYKSTQSEIAIWEQASMQSTLGPDARLPEVLMPLQRWISSDPGWTGGESPQVPPQGPSLLGYDGSETAHNVIAWWVCGPDGYQVARSPWALSQQRDFSFRSYFTGRDHDDAPRQRNDIVWTSKSRPHMSAVFRTRQTNYWVLAISAPIWDEEKFLGVVGIFLRLGSFLERPDQNVSDGISRYAVLLDPRDLESKKASVIEHPYHNLTIAKRDGRLRDDAAMVRLSRNEWTARISKDPFGSAQFGAQSDFGGDWRSASSPVRVPGSDNEFLLAMVRESVDLVQTPSRHLRTNLYWLGVAVAGLFVLPPVILLGLLARLPPRAAT